MAEPQSRFYSRDGVRLHYLDWGGEGRPWLVCIHGLSQQAHTFDPLARRLRDHYHVLSVDVRGRGDSDRADPSTYALPSYVVDLLALFGDRSITGATLVGTSMGGMISIRFAREQPDLVARVVLNDIGPAIARAGIVRIYQYLGSAPEDFATLDEVVEWYRGNFPAVRALDDDQAREWVAHSVRPRGARLAWHYDPALRAQARAGSDALPDVDELDLDLWDAFRALACPLLELRGAESDVLSRKTLDEMRALQPAMEVAEVPGVGHAPLLIEPEALFALKRFLGIPD